MRSFFRDFIHRIKGRLNNLVAVIRPHRWRGPTLIRIFFLAFEFRLTFAYRDFGISLIRCSVVQTAPNVAAALLGGVWGGDAALTPQIRRNTPQHPAISLQPLLFNSLFHFL